MGMENAIIPATAAGSIFRIFANHVQHRQEYAEPQWFIILRHDNNVTALFGTDLLDKFREGFGFREIEGPTWLTSVPVSTRDQQSTPAISQYDDAIVLHPATGSVEFKRMQEGYMTTQKLIENLFVSSLPYPPEVPKGVVEDDEYSRAVV